MGSVTLSHVIGTTALISVFIVTGMYYNVTYSTFETRVFYVQLEEVANYISSYTIDLVSLCLVTDVNQLIFEELDVPASIKNHLYSISLVQLGENLVVRVYLDAKPNIRKDSTLPWSTDGNLKVYNGTDPMEVPDPNLQLKIEVSSGSNAVAWCLKRGEKITIGLGVTD